MRPITFLALLLIGLVGMAVPSRAELVHDWQSRIHYPARLLGIVWAAGRADPTTSIRFGSWTIGFSNRPNYAIYGVIGNDFVVAGAPRPDIHSKGLDSMVCANAARGTAYCALWFYLSGTDKGHCQMRVNFGERMMDAEYIDIPCPVALELAQ